MIAILGPGGVGGFLAAALARAGEPVTVIAREDTVAVINRDGIRVESVRLGDFTARPHATARLTEPGATLVIATKATALAGALERAGIPSRVIDSEPQVLWGKLVRLNALACMTSAYDKLLGEIRVDPVLARELRACVDEAAAVARAEGANVDPGTVVAELADAHATLEAPTIAALYARIEGAT